MNLVRSFIQFIIIVSFFLTSTSFANQVKPDVKVGQKPSRLLDQVLERNVLRVAMYAYDTPPFYYADFPNKNLKGIDVEIIRSFATKLGVEVEFIRDEHESKTLDGVIDLIANKQADIAICKLSQTFNRSSKVLFSKPYIKLRKSLLVNRLRLEQKFYGMSKQQAIQYLGGWLPGKDNSDVDQSDLKNSNTFKIAVIGNSSYVNYAKQRFLRAEIVEYPTWVEVVNAVISGEVLAAFRDEAEVKKVINDDRDLMLKVMAVVLKDDFDPKSIAIQPDAYFLKQLLDFHIDSLGMELSAKDVIENPNHIINQINRYTLSLTP